MQTTKTEIRLPKDPRKQRFADLVLTPMTPTEAYLKAGFSSSSRTAAKSAASRLMKHPDVKAYMADIQQASAEGTVLSVIEKREFLARIVRTPILSIDPNHSEFKDGDLIRKYKRTTSEIGDTEEFEKHCPLKAIEIDNKLSGDDGEAASLAALADALKSIAAGPLPTGKM